MRNLEIPECWCFLVSAQQSPTCTTKIMTHFIIASIFALIITIDNWWFAWLRKTHNINIFNMFLFMALTLYHQLKYRNYIKKWRKISKQKARNEIWNGPISLLIPYVYHKSIECKRDLLEYRVGISYLWITPVFIYLSTGTNTSSTSLWYQACSHSVTDTSTTHFRTWTRLRPFWVATI